MTPVVKRLMIINAAVFVLQLVARQAGLYQYEYYLALNSQEVLQGKAWQIFSYMWLHADFWHLAFNMFGLWMFGGQVESLWGSRRFLNFYLICGTGAGLLIFVYHLFIQQGAVTLGASGAIYGLLTAFSLMWPNRTIMLLFPPIPIKAIWFIPVLFGLQLMMSGGGNVSHIGHLGGVLVAGLLLKDHLKQVLNFRSLRYYWHRQRMKGRLRAVRREEWERRRNDDDRPTFH